MQKILGVLLLALVWLDLKTHVPSQNPTVANWVYAPHLVDKYFPADGRPEPGRSRAMLGAGAKDILRSSAIDDPEHQCESRRVALADDCNLLENIPKLDGFFSLTLLPYDEVLAYTYYHTNILSLPFADYLGISHFNTASNLFDWRPRAGYLPMITAGQQPVMLPPDKFPFALFTPEFSPRSNVLFSANTAAPPAMPCVGGVQLKLHQIAAEHLEVEVDTPQPTLVSVAQPDYHCWRAAVDGNPTPITGRTTRFRHSRFPPGSTSSPWCIVTGDWSGLAHGVLTLVVVVWRCALGAVTKAGQARHPNYDRSRCVGQRSMFGHR